MLTLHTETTIDSSHKLKGYNGKCKQLHGHTWKLECWFQGSDKNLDKVGIMVDFNIVKEIKEMLDHKYINNVVKVNPTAENITKWIFNHIYRKINTGKRELIEIKVRLYETAVDKYTWCEKQSDCYVVV